MKTSGFVVSLAWWALACGSETSGAKCGSGTTLMGDSCVASSGGAAGAAAGGSAGANAGSTAAGADASGGSTVGGAAGASTLGGTPITFSDAGWVDGATNPFGIQGWVWAVDDCVSATGAGLSCVERDASLTGPGGKLGWSISNNVICAKGTVEQVSDWSVQWGFAVGVDLNGTMNGDGMPFDASNLRGFAADISGTAPAQLRFMVTVYGVEKAYESVVAVPSLDATALFEEITQPGSNPQPFDPTSIDTVEFYFTPSMTAPTPYDFCISNLRALEP